MIIIITFVQHQIIKTMDNKKLTELSCRAWDYIDVTDTNVRIFYKVSEEEGMGFEYHAVMETCYVDHPYDEHTEVETLFHGIAYFDGVRHHYMGSEETDNYGYDYCPRLMKHVQVLMVIMNMEDKYCRDAGK